MSNTYSTSLFKEKKQANQYRGMPFWALNGELDEEEIRRQIREFSQCGMGGFFLHARTGLSTEYLSEKWFRCMAAAVDEAAENNMYAWLYDEDRYPSGAGGGLITKDPRYRAKCIFMERLDGEKGSTSPLPRNTIAVFAAVFDDSDTIMTLRSLRQSEEKISLEPGENRLAFYTDTVVTCPWYNNYTYLDTINPGAVDEFIRVTHENYKKHLGHEFGKTIPGIFTDEPRYGFVIHQPEWENDTRPGIPWTPGLLEEFHREYGFRLEDHLPEIFFDVKGKDSLEPRVRYIGLLTKLFVDSFACRINKWCRNNDLIFTGHVVFEDTLSSQTRNVGSAMRFYEYMDMPGIDVLTAKHRAYATCKQLSSAANQFGKKRRLSELYGCTGLNLSIAGFKALGAWQYALGVNFRCQHLALYSTEGEAKRDYPCPVARHSMSPEANRRMEDFFARLSFFLSEGREKREILLLSPIESAWSFIRSNWCSSDNTDAAAFDKKFNSLIQTLLANQLDFDLGEEDIMARHGSVTHHNGKVRMQIGCASYAVIVLPAMITVRATTLALLQEFAAAGGQIITTDDLPAYTDCKKQDISLHTIAAENHNSMVSLLEPFRTVKLSNAGTGCSAVLYQLRNADGYDILFLCNTGHPVDDIFESGGDYTEIDIAERKVVYPEITVEMQSRKTGGIIEFDPETGKYFQVKAEKTAGGWLFRTSLERLAVRLFLAVDDTKCYKAEKRQEEKIFTQEITVPASAWYGTAKEENIMVLDHFSIPSEGLANSFVLSLDDSLRTKLGLPCRGGLMVQPWCSGKEITTAKEITLKTEFFCEDIPEKDISLVMERPDIYTMRLNGAEVKLEPRGFWHEKAWQKCPLPASYLQRGRNEIMLTTTYTNLHSGLESIFLTGDFGVKLSGNIPVMTTPPANITGSWRSGGLPFYPGTVSYSAEITLPSPVHGQIVLENYSGTYTRILVNGEQTAELFFSPGKTGTVALPAKFTLTVELTGSMRNAQGPFYLKECNPVWCGPQQFKTVETQEKQLEEYGIFAPVKIIF